MNAPFFARAPYTPEDWYWFIGDDTANVYSSRRCMLVDAASDQDYLDWSSGGRGAPTLASMAELEEMMAEQYPPGTLKSYALFTRWQKEQGGITTSFGMPIETDDRAQAKINGAMLAAKYPPTPVKAAPKPAPGGGGPAFTTKWHAADGTIWPLDTPMIVAMSGELQLHVDECFEASAAVATGLEDGTITTREQIDEAFAGIATRAGK
jgi:hypothetical protein